MTDKLFVIESGIAMPEKKFGKRGHQEVRSPHALALMKLSVGQSIAIDNREDYAKFSSQGCAVSKRMGGGAKFSTRSMGKNNWRVFRTR